MERRTASEEANEIAKEDMEEGREKGEEEEEVRNKILVHYQNVARKAGGRLAVPQKFTPCNYFYTGHCTKGHRCRYSHDELYRTI